jgi:hypothetical protein
LVTWSNSVHVAGNFVNSLWVAPSVISSGISSLISIFGFADLHSHVLCEFLDFVTVATRSDNGTLFCRVASENVTRSILVIKSVQQRFPVAEIVIVPRPSVFQVSPTSGHQIPQQFSVYGQNFYSSDHLKCLIGKYVAKATFLSNDTLTCATEHKQEFTGNYRIVVSNDGGQTWSSSWAEFEYVPAAIARQVEPSLVIAGMLTSVTVIGNGFSGGSEVVCGLGDLTALHGRWLSAERVVCSVIADRVGNATLRVSSNGGVEWSGGVVLSVLGVGSVARVSPSVGSVSGGSTVRVKGSGFISGPATCLFGNASVPGRVGVDGEAECLSPAHPAGRVGVQVEHSGGVAHGAVQFQYVDDFVVRSVVPSSGAAGTSVAVTVIGSGFVESGMWLRIAADAAGAACNFSSGGEVLKCFVKLGFDYGTSALFLSPNPSFVLPAVANFLIVKVPNITLVSDSV